MKGLCLLLAVAALLAPPSAAAAAPFARDAPVAGSRAAALAGSHSGRDIPVARPVAAASTGSHSGRDIPVAGPLAVVAAGVPDRVIAGSRTRATASVSARSYRTPDGQRVEVATSASYPRDPAADRALVDFLATRAHGRELGSIRLFVGRPAEVAELCGGGDVIACYATAERRMYVPGEDTAGVPVEYVMTHEYGHHVAASRRNDPWPALDWGPKHWASAVDVCAAVRRRALWPGDQGEHYLADPGEGFADGYALMHYPEQPWQYDPLMRPDEHVFEAIRRDVEDPWTGPRTRVVQGRARLRLRLDGEVTVRLAAPRSGRYKVTLKTPGWTARRVLRGGAAIGADACRPQGRDAMELALTVRRLAGAPPARAIVRYPG